MKSIIFITGSRFLMPILLLLSVYVLLRGHNVPGGGFIGGLLAGLAFAMHRLAVGRDALRTALRVDPHMLIGVGLFVALISAILPMASGEAFFTAVWTSLDTPFGVAKVGSPLLFDLGVYIVVIGVVASMLVDLGEQT